MNKKDITMLKKMMGSGEDSPVLRTASCYIDHPDEFTKEAHYQDSVSFGKITEEEASQYIAFLKKGLSGKIGSTVVEVVPEKSELSALRDTQLKEEDAIRDVCEKIKEQYHSDENYSIFLVYGSYDIPSGDADEVFNFVVAMLQPCSLSKAGIVYDAQNNSFKDRKRDRPLGAPVHTFLYPSFDDGHCDMGHAAYFSKNEKVQDESRDVIETLFGTQIPMTAKQQKDGFNDLLEAGYGNVIPYNAMQNVYEKFAELRADAEASGEETQLTTADLTDIISGSGDMAEDGKETLKKVADGYAGKKFDLDNIAPKNIDIRTDKAAVKIELNDISDIAVVTHEGEKCLMIPLHGATIDNLKVR